MAAKGMTMNKLHEFVKEGFENVSTDILQMKEQILNNLVESNKKLQKKIDFLEDQIKNQQISIEANNQYHRRNNIEIRGIPNDIKDDDLENKVIEILEKIDVNTAVSEIEACHRLPQSKANKSKKTIVRFVNRKKTELSLKSKKKLQNINMDTLNLPRDSQLYISENLNRHFQKLAWHCRSLKRNRLIFSFKFQNEAFLIKISKEDKSQKITQDKQLFSLFPGFFVDNIIYS